jgi:hypothetical protein
MRQQTYGGTDSTSRAEFTWHLKNIIMVPADYAIWTTFARKISSYQHRSLQSLMGSVPDSRPLFGPSHSTGVTFSAHLTPVDQTDWPLYGGQFPLGWQRVEACRRAVRIGSQQGTEHVTNTSEADSRSRRRKTFT